MNMHGDKDSRYHHFKVLDDLLNYTLEIRRSNTSEKYGGWRARIEGVIEKIYGNDATELKQIKNTMKLNFLTTSGQTEDQRRIYFNNLYERGFNRVDQLINNLKLQSKF